MQAPSVVQLHFNQLRVVVCTVTMETIYCTRYLAIEASAAINTISGQNMQVKSTVEFLSLSSHLCTVTMRVGLP